MKDFWNKRYQDTDFVYGTQPNVYFKEQINLLKPGSLILPADGEGRNAVYAASKGWDVTAVDYSKEGRDKALQLANAKSVKIQYHLSDLSVFDFPVVTYDAVAFIYVHLPRSIIETVYQNVINSLKKGATVIVEVYSINQLGRDSGGPQDERVLYTKNRLKELLSGTEIQFLEEQEIELNEGKYHNGKAMVLRALATRS
jgi:SAM-dependent methyltransferase